jgi:hypothetical protein
MKRVKLVICVVTLSMLAAAVPPASSTSTQDYPLVFDPEIPRYSADLDRLRQELIASGTVDVELLRAEYITTAEGFDPATSQTLAANDRTHLLPYQFVKNDPRRGGRSYITYVIDQSDGGALTLLPGNVVGSLPNSYTEPLIDQSMAQWQSSPECNGPAIVKIADSGGNIDVVDDIFFRRPRGSSTADITHAGWISSGFFNVLAPGGSRFILGVAISFGFVDENGDPTDIDGNGLGDVAFVEIYYNRGFSWSQIGDESHIDIETIATHETGHGLGLNHFGRVFLTKNGNPGILEDVKFAPRAVMNAVYVSDFSNVTGTDKASFCQIWSNSN